MTKVLKGNRKRMGWREAIRELVATLADVWACADLRTHLESWWEVITGKTMID